MRSLGLGSALLLVPPLLALEAPRPRMMQALRLERPMELRGDLSDPQWAKAKLDLPAFRTYNPTYGEDLGQDTEVYLACDEANLYVGFYCRDREPGRIKASLAKRDGMFSDDWVGLSLDAFGTHQSAYDLFVNPLGIQGDIHNTLNGGENAAPDWVWDSRAKLQPDGYTVEIRIPLKSIRFRSGSDVRMGVLFWRRLSRLGLSGSWPAIPPGQSVFNAHAPVRLGPLKAPVRLEVLPAFTASTNHERTRADSWSRDRTENLGLGVKVGLNSSINAEITYKPDFSQVESDAYQVEVNQRYPIFYEEKRPFFMESMSIFQLAGVGGGDTNMVVPVHTRRIVDPLWGAKVAGDEGSFSFGVLAASDRAPGKAWEEETNPDEGRRANFGIARGMYGFGKANYIGALATRRSFAGTTNEVVGADFSVRLDDGNTFSGNILDTRTEEPIRRTSGLGYLGSWSYGAKNLDAFLVREHYDRDFRMDTAFYQRTGIDQTLIYFGPKFYPKLKSAPWLQRVNPFLFGSVIQDHASGLTDYVAVAALRINTTHQGSFRADVLRLREGWMGRLYNQTVYRLQGSAWWTKWLSLGGNLRVGDGLFYSDTDPFLGRTWAYGLNSVLQPDENLRVNLDYSHTRMRHPQTRLEAYDVKTFNSQATYQFNRYAFLRLTARYDTYKRRLLTDLLASFTYIPGTVIHLGYGEVFEKGNWREEGFEPLGSTFHPTRKSLFLKVSYLWRN
jgi:hypothetical protein